MLIRPVRILMAYYELKQEGVNPETDLNFRYSGGHPATAAMVETGVVDAGAIDETVFNFLIRGVANDQEYTPMQKLAHELKMF